MGEEGSNTERGTDEKFVTEKESLLSCSHVFVGVFVSTRALGVRVTGHHALLIMAWKDEMIG